MPLGIKIIDVRKIIRNIFVLFGVSLLITSCNPSEESISSPDGSLKLTFLVEEGVPMYAFSKGNSEVIQPSSLGFKFLNIPDMNADFEIIGIHKKSANLVWEQPYGEFKTITDKHNKLFVELQEKGGKKRLMNVVFKLFNDGLGFRYEFPKQEQIDSVQIADELTAFTFPEEHEVWWTPVHSDNSYYESFYQKTPIGDTDTINTPATFETKDGLYLAIHEANLTDYASMTLRKVKSNQYVSELVPWANGVKVYAKAPFVTPWRTIIVAEKAADLVTSTLMLNLNEPCVIADVSWIEPSKYIGIWWGMHLEKYTWGQGPKHGATTKNAKEYIDFAAQNGIDGVLIEGWNEGWDGDWTANGTAFSFTQAYPDFDLEEVCRYAATKNVRIIGHHETAGAAKHYENQLEEAFALYQKNGINAVKTGYVNKFLDGKEWHDGQYGVRHYRKVIETAANYQIMIDNHEPVKGTGLQRTYPNLMTQEGGRGQEYDAWSADGGNPPEHTTIMPFTRMLSGPFDFTPGTFNFDYQVIEGTRVQTTLAKQLALFVVIYSPQQMASDLPENYVDKPAFEFLKKVPCSWADTKVLNAEIGQYVSMARKDWNNDDWYVGSITNKEARQIEIQLSFLDADKKYKAEIYSDGAEAHYRTNPYPLVISSKEVDSNSVIKLNLAPGGGAAIHFTPVSTE